MIVFFSNYHGVFNSIKNNICRVDMDVAVNNNNNLFTLISFQTLSSKAFIISNFTYSSSSRRFFFNKKSSISNDIKYIF